MNLRPYQHLMIEHIMAGMRVAELAGMGMGKTMGTLTGIDNLSLTEDVYPMIVLAPKRVARDVWPHEIAKWDHLKHLHIEACVGTSRERVRALSKKPEILTTNYENLPWLVSMLGDKWPYKTVVADESTRLKNFRTRQGGVRAKALARVAHAGKVKRWINLTGTPVPNGLKDMWGQQWFLDRGERLGSTYTAYMDRWFRQSYNGFSYDPMPHAMPEIMARLQDVCLTLKPEDWFDLKQPNVTNLYVDLPSKVRTLYRAMEKEMFAQLASGKGVEAFNAAALTQKCSQIANGAVYYDDKRSWEEVHDEKIQALESVVEETNGAPLLVVYQYQHDLERLKQAFKQAKTMDSPGVIEAWNSGRVPILLVHPQSAGHGLNLQHGGHHCVYFSLTWNLEAYQQVVERIGPVRQSQAGYDRVVQVYHILARDTIDDDMLERLAGKKSVQEVLMDAMRRRG